MTSGRLEVDFGRLAYRRGLPP